MEHQIFRFAEMILRDRCKDNYSRPNGTWYAIKTLDNNSCYTSGPGNFCSRMTSLVVEFGFAVFEISTCPSQCLPKV